jgi:DNA-binding transcriptional LysR family regulator
MIDRYLLRYFLAVIDNGNFSKAAAQCNVSQPTLSVGIAKLEQGLGRPLFRRTNRRVELTEAGVRFAVHARRIETEFSLAEQDLGASQATKTFRLGVLTSIPTAWVEALAARLSPDLAQDPVALIEGRERDLLERLTRGRIDAALTIIRPGDNRFDSEVLRTEGYSLALPTSHALADKRVIAAEALADNVMIVRRHCEVLAETSRHFTLRGVRPFFTAKTTNDYRALALVGAGFGVTVMPDGFTAAGVVRPRLAGFDLVRNLGILHGDRINDLGGHPALAAVRDVMSTVGGSSLQAASATAND